MAVDGINKPTNQRPNYFAGQYLLEDDFQLEQKYQIDRQRWHHHLLHISGIAEGLKVDKIENILFVKISAGSAIDPQGRQIILLDDKQVDLTKSYSTTNAAIPDGIYTLYIGYSEQKTDQQTAGNDITSRHWQENPQFQLTTSELKDFISLAKLTIKSNLVSGNIDNSLRVYSGLRLPSYDGEITLRAQKGETKSLAELTGSLSIAGTLSVTGNVGIGTTNPPTEKLEISGGNLKVSGNISATNESLSGNLSVTGNVGIGTINPTEKLEISGGNLKVSGNISATNESLNGNLSVTGNVGIGTTNPPTEKLEISGGNLKVSGNISATNAILSGNIGIGTTNPPTEKLEISGGNLKVSGNISATNAILSGNVGIGTTNPPTEKLEISGGNLKVSGNISATNAILSGNVGIGTGSTTPIKKLQIESGELRVKASHNNEIADIGAFYANNLTQGIGIGYNRIEAIGSNTNQDILIRPKGSGNVGISTTNIAAKLQVEIDRTTTTASLKLEHNGSNFIVRPVSAGGTSSIIENTGGGSLIINPTGGNVGIGTISPGNKLSISASSNHLQLRRENTETTGDKLLFLELYQDDPLVNKNPTVPEVYPSIRFHHNNRYWHRIEAKKDGLHFKTGNLDKDDYINIYAANVASCAETLQMIRGTVETNGTALAGTGFTVTRNSTGFYTITFSTAFSNVPTVVATQQHPANNDFSNLSQNTRDNAVVVGVSTTKFQVKCGDGEGTLSDRRFHFIAIGPR